MYNNITLYHTAKIIDDDNGWSVASSQPASTDCEVDCPDCTTDHPAMGAVQQPLGWSLVGVIDEGESVSGVFAIDFDDQR